MGYRWVDHTAELELLLDGATQAQVFADALAALAELLGEGPHGRDDVVFELTAAAPDRATLLAGWLDELVFRAETEQLVPDAVEQLELGDGALRARVRAHRGEPRHVVKGVTYHRLTFERIDGGYRARVVLDV